MSSWYCTNPDTLSELTDDFDCPNVGDSEDPISYESGGFHPVYLGEFYDNGRYRIVHKIGAGDIATVWLARDSVLSAWVALKIIRANESLSVQEGIFRCHDIFHQHKDPRFITPTRYFHIHGLNGRHLCLVLPFCGPSLATLSDLWLSRVQPRWARALAFQAAEILRDLHSLGLCHGNIRPNNLLLRIKNLDHLDDNGIYHLFGQPKIDQVKTETGRLPGPEVPRYIVGFLDFMSSNEDILKNEVCLIGLEDAFHVSSPPEVVNQLPQYLAPEVAIGKRATQANDVWALGLAISNLRAGFIPFMEGNIGGPVDLVTTVIQYFGNLPASWTEPLYHFYSGCATLDKKNGVSRVTCDETLSLKQWISNIWDEPVDLNENTNTPAKPFIIRDEDGTHPRSYEWLGKDLAAVITYDPNDLEWLLSIHNNMERPYPEHYAKRFWKPCATKIEGSYLPGNCGEEAES
ncbi:hypothetical protein ACLX1H_010092 [Fusarium chlamydosporum]